MLELVVLNCTLKSARPLQKSSTQTWILELTLQHFKRGAGRQ